MDNRSCPSCRNRLILITPIKPADIAWSGEVPNAPGYDDIYYTDHAGDGGIGDVRRFFIDPADVPAKVAAGRTITIGELGFGTGLNFALCADLALAHPGSRLHFISFEAHPLTTTDWKRVAEQRSQLTVAHPLADSPPPLLTGWHRRRFFEGRIELSVYHGLVEDGLADFAARHPAAVDAWLLDGFAPDRNTDMWIPDLFSHIAKLSGPGTTVATFTANGRVRRALTDAGFTMRKVDQQPVKRESLAGTFEGTPNKAAIFTPLDVHVVGAGIGGATMARQCAEAGARVLVSAPKTAANTLPSTVLHARLLGDGSPQADLRVASYHHALAEYRGLPGVERSGALQLQGPNLDEKKLRRIVERYAPDSDHRDPWFEHVSATRASELADLPLTGESLWFPTACTVNLKTLIDHLLDHPGIELRDGAITPGMVDADVHTILCNGVGACDFLETLEIAPIYGQLDQYLSNSPLPSIPLVGNGYCVPGPDRTVTLGASYEYSPWEDAESRAHNLGLNERYVDRDQIEWSHSFKGVRAVTSDRHPVIGRIEERLWIATGLGSMGTSYAPAAATIVTSQLTGKLIPFSDKVLKVVDPGRFAERQKRRGKRRRRNRG